MSLDEICLTIQKSVSDYTYRTPPHLRDCDVLTGHIIRAIRALAPIPPQGDTIQADIPERLLSITVDGSTHTRTAQQWLDLARADLAAPSPNAQSELVETHCKKHGVRLFDISDEVSMPSYVCPVCQAEKIAAIDVPAFMENGLQAVGQELINRAKRITELEQRFKRVDEQWASMYRGMQNRAEAAEARVKELEPLVREIHQVLKRGKDTEDHGLIGNLRCILDAVCELKHPIPE